MLSNSITLLLALSDAANEALKHSQHIASNQDDSSIFKKNGTVQKLYNPHSLLLVILFLF
jgi:hypothetical protein